METLEEIAEAVINDGTLTVAAWELRDAYGSDRLGRLVREGISSKLSGLGIGHWPSDIPQSQEQNVRLYHKGSPTGALITAVLDPSPETDQLITRAVTVEAEEVLRRIRELVCE